MYILKIYPLIIFILKIKIKFYNIIYLFIYLVLQVKIWFQNRRTKWKKIDNISNVEAAEHKNNNSKSSDEGRTRIYKQNHSHSQSSNSSIESDTKSSVTSAVADPIQAKTFKDILQTNHPTIPLSPKSHFQSQIDSAKDVLLNLSFDVQEKS